MSDASDVVEVSLRERGAAKTARNPVKVAPAEGRLPRKPPWIRVRALGFSNVASGPLGTRSVTTPLSAAPAWNWPSSNR